MYCFVDFEHRVGAKDSEGGSAYVIQAGEANSGLQWQVEYVIGRRKEWVTSGRITERSVSQALKKRDYSAVAPPEAPPAELPPLADYFLVGNQPFINDLASNSRKADGWLRQREWQRRGLPGEPSKQLTPDEKVILALQSVALGQGGNPERGGQTVGQPALNSAWGLTRARASVVAKQLFEDGNPGRVLRSDKGLSNLNDPDYAEGHVTPFSIYKRDQQAGPTTGTGARRDAAAIKEDFDKLSENDLAALGKRRTVALERLRNIPRDIEEALRQVNGSITFADLAVKMGPEVSESAVRYHVMGLDGFSYKSVGTHPAMTAGQKDTCVRWSTNFWIFWNSAALLKLRVLLCHNDEKVSDDVLFCYYLIIN